MTSPVEKDFGLRAVLKLLSNLKTTTVTFGYQGPSGDASHPGSTGSSVSKIAAIHEFGYGVTARPLGRTTVERAAQDFARAQSKALSDVIDMRQTDGLSVAVPIGILAVRELRKTIDMSRSWAEANAKSTIAKKGHDQPLVGEFASLYEAASYAVRVNGVIVDQGSGT